MKKVTHTDRDGRHTLVWLPDSAPDSDARLGIPIGPPALDGLGLPKKIEVRLHNELFAREVYTIDDVKRRRQDVIGALMATFKVDAVRIVSCYQDTTDRKGDTI